MKRNFLTKLALVFTCLCTLLIGFIGISPITASADGEMSTGAGTELDPYIVTTEVELTTALTAGDTVYVNLGANITATANHTIAGGKTVILDLSGYTLDFGSYSITNNGKLELRGETGGEITGTYLWVLENCGSFTLTSGIVSNTNGNASDESVAIYNNGSDSEAIINGGTLNGACGGIYNEFGSLTINDGAVIAASEAIDNWLGGVTVNGGEIRGGTGIQNEGGNVEMTGGLITASKGIVYFAYAGGTVTLSGGTIDCYVAIDSYDGDVADCLASGYIYYKAINGEVLTLTEGQKVIDSWSVTIDLCQNHSGGTATCTTLAVCTLCKLEYGAYYYADDNGDIFCDACGGLPITEVTFPDETFRNIVSSAEFDIDQDGLLSPEEIASVTNLWLEGRGFTDITGINYFTELTYIDAQNNNFTSLDLSGLTKLEILYLGGNPNLASLNLDGCTALKALNLVECKVAASLDFSAFTELTYLSVGSVKDLYLLDLSGNTKLEKLDVSASSLTSLDLSNNPLITELTDSTYRTINHCCVGYVNMNLYGDVNKMINITGGTMGADGWLKLEVGTFEILYEYITGDGTPNLSVRIVFNDDYANQHTYIDQPVSKDENGHYAQSCSTCRTGNEEATAEHTFVDGICTVCGYACVHTTHNDAGVCDVCKKQRGFSVTVGDSVSYFDDMYEAFDATTTGTEQSPATVKLLTNVTHTTKKIGVVSAGAYVVLDLNGYTLTFAHEDAGIDVVEGSHFTLMDSSDGETGSIVADYEEQYPTGSYLIHVSGQSTMILQGGRLVPDIFAAEAIHVIETSTLIQNGGVIEGTAFNAVSVYTGSLFTQNGGTIVSNGYAVEIEDNGSRYVLEDGTLFLNGNWATMGGGYFDFCQSDGTVTINGGIFDAVGASDASISSPTQYMIGRGSYGDCKIIINAATFKNTDNAALYITDGCYDGTITIQFKNVVFENGLALYYPETQTLGEYLAPGYLYYDENGNVITLTEGMTELTGKITVDECNHKNCTYTASDNVITETCNIENCSHSATATIGMEDTAPYYNGTAHYVPVTYSDGWAGGALTVSYSGTAYDGSDYAVTGPVSAGSAVYASISIGGATAEFGYSILSSYVDVGTVSVVSPTTVYNSTNIADIVLERTNTTVPGTLTFDEGQSLWTNKTEYTWIFTPDDTVNYYVTTGTVSITVVQDVWVKLEIVTPPTKTTYTYGESFDFTGIKVVATYLSGRTEEIPYNMMDDQFTPDELTVATTEVSCTLTVDYVNEFTITQKITVNPKVVDNAFIELVHSNYFYTGQPIEGVVDTVYDGDYCIAASEYTVVITNNTDVGTATVTIVDVAGGNYVVNGSTTFEIVPAKITNASVSQTGTLTYTGSAQTPTVNASATTVDGAAVTFTYSLEQNGTYTAELPTVVGGGTHTIYFKVNAERHEEYSGTFEVVVGKATNGWAINPGIASWTYGETPPTPVGQAMFGTVKYYHKPMGTDIMLEGLPTEPGKYYLVAKIDTTDDYYGGQDEGCIFNIYKAETTADIFDFTPPANLDACDGLAKAATVTVKEGIEGVGSITIKYFKNGEPIDGAPTTVGTYTVKIEVVEGANYLASKEPIEDAKWTFTFDITDEEAHKNVTLVSNGDGTHDKVCTVCEKVIESGITCSGATTDDCDKGYKCSCGGYFGTKEHDFSGNYLHDADGHWHECADCSATDTKEEHSGIDDGSCLTAVICYCETVVIEAKDKHDFDNACDTDCNNPGCEYTRTTYHESLPDDGNCTTPIRCVICQVITTEAKEHSFDNTCDTTCNNKDCKHTRAITHTPSEDDGDCETAIHCRICDAITTSAKIHSYTNACDTTCNNDGCTHTRVTYHESLPDDGNCTTPIRCVICQVITTEAKEHSFDNTCDTTCNNKDCKHTRTITHTPSEDDGDCETAIHCKICDAITTTSKSHSFTNACDTDCNNDGCTHTRVTHHEPLPDDGDCKTPVRCAICQEITTEAKEHSFDNTCDTTCNNKDCKHTRAITHTPSEDDGDCETAIHCKICDAITTTSKSHSFTNACDTDCNNDGCEFTRTTEHRPEADDDDCTTDILCSVCDAVTTKGNESHTGGTATCTTKAKCSVCGTAYGSILAHTPDEDDGDCTTAIQCSVCDGITTEAKSHAFDNSCDTTCNNVGCTHTREITHEFDNACDVDCNVCGDSREVGEHSYGEDGICSECGDEKPADSVEEGTSSEEEGDSLGDDSVSEEKPTLSEDASGENSGCSCLGQIDGSIVLLLGLLTLAVALKRRKA